MRGGAEGAVGPKQQRCDPFPRGQHSSTRVQGHVSTNTLHLKIAVYAHSKHHLKPARTMSSRPSSGDISMYSIEQIQIQSMWLRVSNL